MIDRRVFWLALLGSAIGSAAALAVAGGVIWWWLAT